MAYMPKAYIDPGTSIMRHPSINGWTDWYASREQTLKTMLGSEINPNLLHQTAPKVFDASKNIQGESAGNGLPETLKVIRDKKKAGC